MHVRLHFSQLKHTKPVHYAQYGSGNTSHTQFKLETIHEKEKIYKRLNKS